MEQIFNDSAINQSLLNNFSNDYNIVVFNRVDRRNKKLKNFMQDNNFSSIPLPILDNLINAKAVIENYRTQMNDPTFLNAQYIQLEQQIQNSNYAVLNSPEYYYHINYVNFESTFSWPDANELTIRQQEEAELLALLE